MHCSTNVAQLVPKRNWSAVITDGESESFSFSNACMMIMKEKAYTHTEAKILKLWEHSEYHRPFNTCMHRTCW